VELFYFSPKKIARFLTCIVLGLTLTSFAGQVFGHAFNTSIRGFIERVDVGSDLSIPTWYSSLALAFCGLLLTVIAVSKKQTQDSYWRHWGFLAALFVGFSIDEVAMFHETLGNALRPIINTTGFLYYNWVVYAIPLVIVFVLSYLKFLFHLPAKTRRLFCIAGSMYVGGAIGVEMFASLTYSTIGAENLVYAAFTTIEECLEMLGVVVFIYALLSYLNLQNIQSVQICLTEHTPIATQSMASYAHKGNDTTHPEAAKPKRKRDEERHY
jgi:hypothetical protein